MATGTGEQVVTQGIGPPQGEVAQLGALLGADVDLQFREPEDAGGERLHHVDGLHLVEGHTHRTTKDGTRVDTQLVGVDDEPREPP